ncbi:two component response regulator [Bordetella ansorpii]|uniref:Two component response regulator n=1 Tax=Bordetella ansorpii TaxID=288768 RepID=A0A157PKF1_9BORD|nr:response regulator [Bordetella ansorpii]SAI33987.1 two component response regulator [Bordetella ansorpii]
MSALPVIAIVDDDASVRTAVGRLLRSIDLEVRLYDCGQALLDDIGTAEPDCVVTDIRMPGLSGFELCAALRRRGMDVPVIVMTAYVQEGFAQRASEAQATCFIQKPFADTQLIACIEHALGDGAARR